MAVQRWLSALRHTSARGLPHAAVCQLLQAVPNTKVLIAAPGASLPLGLKPLRLHTHRSCPEGSRHTYQSLIS